MEMTEALERLRYFGSYFCDDTPEEGLASLRAVLARDPEFWQIAFTAFDRALSGEAPIAELRAIVLNDFNRWVETDEEAIAYLRSIQQALFG